MALIKTSALVSDISGKVGGNVFARNRAGAYVRQFTKPTNPNTPAQAGVRGIFGTNASAWRDLSAAQKQSFNEAAPNYPYTNRMGETAYYSGQGLYSRVNTLAMLSGLDRIESMIPSPLKLPDASMSEASIGPHPWETIGTGLDEGRATLLVPGDPTTEWGLDDYVAIYASNVVSTGIFATSSVSYRLIGVYKKDDTEWSWLAGELSLDILADWKAIYGEPSVAPGSAVVLLKARLFNSRNCFAIPIGAGRVEIIEGTP